MKALLVFAAVLSVSAFAQAGDNGSHLKCVSSSGRTELLIGNLGAGTEIVKFSIDGKTFGEAQIESEVILQVSKEASGVKTYKFTEADHDALNWVTVRLSAADGKGRQKGSIIGGMDPRVQGYPTKQIESPISVRCKTVYNPI